jgi:murein DD-endopeptidase MepM/ murein hydrolase activator NlpD
MPADDALPWILGGGAAATAIYFWQRGRKSDPSSSSSSDHRGAGAPTPPAPTSSKGTGSSSGSGKRPEPLPGRWVWPVGVWNNRKPEITDGFHGMRREPGSNISIEHGGVDIMYRRKPGDPWRAGTPNGTPLFVMPDHRAALAASDGVVWSAAKTPRGWSVVIDHGPRKLATYYTHLSSVFVTAKQAVSAGAPIGIIDADPVDAQGIKHLHLEIWRGRANDRSDPQRLIETTWEYLPDPGDLPRPQAARNAGQRARDRAEFTVPVEFHYRRPPRR